MRAVRYDRFIGIDGLTFEELARLTAEGSLDFPIAARFPLEAARDAYRLLAERSPFGRVVLHPQD